MAANQWEPVSGGEQRAIRAKRSHCPVGRALEITNANRRFGYNRAVILLKPGVPLFPFLGDLNLVSTAWVLFYADSFQKTGRINLSLTCCFFFSRVVTVRSVNRQKVG